MNPNPDIDSLLRNAKVPDRPSAYWRDFPGRVTRQIRELDRRPEAAPRASRWSLKTGVWNFAAAMALLFLGFLVGHWHGANRPDSTDAAARYARVYREMSQMFPNQVRAIVMGPDGIHLVLADQANVPASQPVLVKVGTGGQTQRIITFSGQQIPLNGETCEVMTDSEGNVILVGRGWCWSSKESKSGRYRIEAQSLETML